MGQSTKAITAQKKKEFKEKMKAKQKDHKKILKEKRARLIVKNLPFTATEEKLKEHFTKYGDIKEVQLLKKGDGKLVGCGFIQYLAVQHAAKAKHHTNGKPFLGRNIECDFVLAKKQFLKKQKEKKKLQEIDLSVVKIEDDADVKKEDESTVKNNNNDDDDDIDDDKSDDEDDKTDDEVNDVKVEQANETKKRIISNDVNEGKTVFVKSIPFEATEDDLKECMLQFGPIFYAKICIDPMTEHSKGTGFVKFRNKEDADCCLEAGTELQLLGNILDCHKALGKSEIQKKSVKDKKVQSDNRNLYLMKEGLILAGSPASEGVSAPDMAKRLQIEQYKSQMLKKLNMFVSRTRLIVHNLSHNMNNVKLKYLLLKHAGPKAVITEARIMRNMFKVDDKGEGESKQYAFVNFTTHEHALNALRSLNNNPTIWTAKRRPIIGFSIENRDMIKARENRSLVSKRKNPLSKDYVPAEKMEKKNFKAVQAKEYSGVAAEQGVNNMRSKHNLNSEAKLHQQQLNLEKLKKKMQKKKKTDKFVIKQSKQVQNSKKDGEKLNEDKNFSKLVDSYKRKLMNVNAGQNEKKARWFE